MNFTIPNAPLKGIFFIHFLFSTWAIQASWLPGSYFYYNIVLLVVLLWSLHNKDSEEPVIMAFGVNILSIFLDVISVAIYYPRAHDYSEVHFSAAMFIINLLLRPVTSVLLVKVYNERSGRYNNLGFPGFGIGRGPYEDIDQPATQSVPKTTVDTGSPAHLPDAHLPPYSSTNP